MLTPLMDTMIKRVDQVLILACDDRTAVAWSSQNSIMNFLFFNKHLLYEYTSQLMVWRVAIIEESG